MIKRFTNCLSVFSVFVVIFSLVVNLDKDLWYYYSEYGVWTSPFMTLFYNLHSYHGFNPVVDTLKLVIVLSAPILLINYICFNKITVWHKG